MGAIKWIGGAIGWATGGIIGGIIGFALGSLLENAVSGQYAADQNSSSSDTSWQRRARRPLRTQEGDFGISLLILSAAIMRSDNRLLKSELNYIKDFFTRQFGPEKAANYILLFKDLLQKDYPVQEVCFQIRQYMDYSSRLQLIHYLFGLSMCDNQVHPVEMDLLFSMSGWLGLSPGDYESIKAMFIKDNRAAYAILEITQDASEEDIKKAYKRMAMKYHPDKVAHLGTDAQRAANEKFKEVNLAYETIKKEKGWK